MPPHLHDLRQMLDKGRADLHAGAAGGATPESRFACAPRAPLSYQRNIRFAHRVPPDLFQCPAVFKQVLLYGVHHLSRVELLPGGGRRADVLASAALGAGKGIEEVLPTQTVHAVGAERITLAELLALLGVALAKPAQVDVGDRCQDVHVLAVRQEVHEPQKRQGMDPP